MRAVSHIQTSRKITTFYQYFSSINKFTPNRSIPEPNTRNILITAALPYVNNTPHLGNIIGAILSADTYARYCRMRQYNTLFVCGTDEYGTTTQVKALQQKVTPKQICDKYHVLHKEIYDWFQIQFDYFGRTSQDVHSKITNQIFKDLYQRGFAQIKTMKQFQCAHCKISLADRYVVGQCGSCGAKAKGDQCDGCSTVFRDPTIELKQPKCSICGNTPQIKDSQHLYLKLSQCSDSLKKWLIESDGMKNWTNNARAVTKAWLNNSLQDRCITRNLNWGVPVPEQYLAGKKVFYVWFQAPIGYLSITAAALGSAWRKWWLPERELNVQLNQFMGKDNIAFHSILAPATLQNTGKPYIKPHRLSVTQYLMYEGGKFSKSNNIGVFGDDCKNTGIKSDVWRFFLLLSRPEVYDTEFLWQDLTTVNKKDLMNIVGNMCLRVLKYTYTNLKNQVPLINPANYGPFELRLVDQLSTLLSKYCQHLENVEIKAGCHVLIQIGQALNKYIQDTEFWNKKNVLEQRNKLIIGFLLRILQFYALLMEPYLPNTSEQILKTLSLTPETLSKFPKNREPSDYFREQLLNPDCVETGNNKWKQIKLQKPQILFEDIPPEKIKELVKLFGVNKKVAKTK